MGNKPSFMLQDEEITLISEETGFTPCQIERLYSRFTTLDKSGNGSLSRQDCLAIPELAINPLCDRIVYMFFIDCDEDHERINFRQFMKVLATFRSSQKASPLSRSRNVSRQESLNLQQQQSIQKQAHLLFDSIDPSPFSSALTRHSRHSSFHDGFNDTHHQHHTTNQHSIHYAASSTHLPSANGYHHHHNNHQNPHHQHHLFQKDHHANNLPNGNGNMKNSIQLPLVDLEEPANSRKQKLYFMFKIYDVNDDNLLDIEDLTAILKLMVGTYVDDARVHRIAERTLREADKNCDGFIDFEEFSHAFARKDIDDSLEVKFSRNDRKA